jgi:hypothetical protein
MGSRIKFVADNLLSCEFQTGFAIGAADGGKAPSFLDFCISESQFILWKPDAYWHMHNVTIKCPHCEKADPVLHKGWRKKARRVCGNNTTYYLYSFEYSCKSCRKFSNAYEINVGDALYASMRRSSSWTAMRCKNSLYV